jgi:hypothetical protein
MGCDGPDWIHLARDMVKLWTFLNAVMSLMCKTRG